MFALCLLYVCFCACVCVTTVPPISATLIGKYLGNKKGQWNYECTTVGACYDLRIKCAFNETCLIQALRNYQSLCNVTGVCYGKLKLQYKLKLTKNKKLMLFVLIFVLM